MTRPVLHAQAMARASWCQPLAEGGFRTGFSLLDARGTDYEGWRQFTAETGDAL